MDGNNGVLKSFIGTKTLKAEVSIHNKSSIYPEKNLVKTRPNMVKQNTDYLFARQLSEEMESTIVRIQPGSKASNYDKVSRQSSSVYKKSNDSNKMLFGATFHEPSQQNPNSIIDIAPIGEHITDEDESSKFASNFGTTKLKEKTGNDRTFRDAIEECSNMNEKKKENIILASSFDLSLTRKDSQDNNMVKLPTSSFNQEHSESSFIQEASSDEESDGRHTSGTIKYNINVKSSAGTRPSKEHTP